MRNEMSILDNLYSNREIRLYNIYSPSLRSERSGLLVLERRENMLLNNVTSEQIKEAKDNYIEENDRRPIIILNSRTFINFVKDAGKYDERLESVGHATCLNYDMYCFVIDETMYENDVEIR